MKAFPSIDWDSQIESKNNQLTPISSGMDLRDYFAAKAFQSLISYALPDCVYYTIDNQSRIEIGIEILAKDAYLFADAMMKARTE
jgi:hypothetical protein